MECRNGVYRIKKKASTSLDFLNNLPDNLLKGRSILITAGPTREKIDDVRYISNYSSGKMGFALAESALQAGANVTLIAGPVNLQCSSEIKRIDVESAEEMYNASIEHFSDCNIAILSAAVADYTPKQKISGKMKKGNADFSVLELIKTKDILFELGKLKTKQILIGFALEAENELEYGYEKMRRKNCDAIVVNSISIPDSAFSGDNNTISIISRKLCSWAIINEIAKLL